MNSLSRSFGFLTVLASPAIAQVPPANVDFTVPAAPSAAALAAKDLRWIRSAHDFDQSGLTADAIDAEIARRVGSYSREQPIATFEVPINGLRLSRGANPVRYDVFDARIGALNIAKNGGALDRKAYFWTYRGFHIAVYGDTHRDQLNVHAVARALEILRVRYPTAFQRLFQDVQTFPATAPTQAAYKNRFSSILFSFDTSSVGPASATAYGNNTAPAGSTPAHANIAVISINPVSASGTIDTIGTRPIYLRTPDESYMRYLREGLVETLVHEMLHRYVDYRYAQEPVFNQLYNLRNNSNNVLALDMEEAIVIATSMGYFLREGGLQGSVPYFYRGTFEMKIQNVQRAQSGLVDHYAGLIRPAATTILYKERLRLPVLD